MRLFLSSYRLGKQPERLLDLIPNGRHVAIIANACDARPAELRKERYEREVSDLGSLGLKLSEIDLRDYFDGSFTEERLSGYDLVWVRGGNAFNLRRAMKQSGFDHVVTNMLQRDAIAYGGYSAGECVLAPTLHGIEFCDPLDDIPVGYPREVIWEGLRITPHIIVPHYRSDNPESPLIDNVVAYMDKEHIPYETQRDGEVTIIIGDKTEKLV